MTDQDNEKKTLKAEPHYGSRCMVFSGINLTGNKN